MANICLTTLFFYSCILLVNARSECIVSSLDRDIDSFYDHEDSICGVLPNWIVGNYSQIGLESPDERSEIYISPRAGASCISSFSFNITAGGVVEVNVYTDSKAGDHISLLVMMTNHDGPDTVIATTLLGQTDPGWHQLRMDVNTSIQEFEGYISFIGIASGDSRILVDSFRYIPPAYSENLCVVYELEEKCVTYNFEEDFEISFTTDNYLCEGFQPWHLDNYTTAGIESPNNYSTVFMAPAGNSSCISSFLFAMSPKGTIEANIYMKSISTLDHIIVLAQRKTQREVDTVVGFQQYYPENQVFVDGWNVIRFPLLDLTNFEGYLVFIGSAVEGSTVLVDSVRYIPPQIPPEDKSCILY